MNDNMLDKTFTPTLYLWFDNEYFEYDDFGCSICRSEIDKLIKLSVSKSLTKISVHKKFRCPCCRSIFLVRSMSHFDELEITLLSKPPRTIFKLKSK